MSLKRIVGGVGIVAVGAVLFVFVQSALAQSVDPETRLRLVAAAELANIAERRPSLSGAVESQGWTVLDEEFGLPAKHFVRGGYYQQIESLIGPDRWADAFVVRRGGVVVLVFPGARESVDFFDAANDHRPHLALYAPLFGAIEGYVNNPANNVSEVMVVGHSFGGGLAEAYLRTNANALLVPTSGIVFGSIGTNVGGTLATNDIISVRHLGDPVNITPRGFVRAGEPLELVYAGSDSPFVQHAMSSYLKTILALSDDTSPIPNPPSSDVVQPGGAVPAAQFWPATGASFWLIYDANGDPASGHFALPEGGTGWVWNGSRWALLNTESIPSGTVVAVADVDWQQLGFIGGTQNGIIDPISAAPYLNGTWQSWQTVEIMTFDGNLNDPGSPAPPPPPPAL